MSETDNELLFEPKPDPALEALLDAAIEADFAARPIIPTEPAAARRLKPATSEAVRTAAGHEPAQPQGQAPETTVAVPVNLETLNLAIEQTGVEDPAQLVEFALRRLTDHAPSNDWA
jgi:hypothetical protein